MDDPIGVETGKEDLGPMTYILFEVRLKRLSLRNIHNPSRGYSRPDDRTIRYESKMRQNSAYTAYYGSVSYSSRFVFVGRCRKRTTSRYCCSFPFIYKGRRYNSCTKKNHNRPWCSLTGNYDRDKKWGNCAGKFQILSPTKNLSSILLIICYSFLMF